MMMLFRTIIQRRQKRSKTQKKQKRDRQGCQGQARDHGELLSSRRPTNAAAAVLVEPDETLLLLSEGQLGTTTTTACTRTLLETIPSSIEAVDNCFYYKGVRVEIIDWTNKVFVIDLVPAAVCNLLRSTVMHHCRTQTMNGKATWRTLYTYTRMDLPCCEVAKITAITQMLISNVNGLLAHLVHKPNLALRPRSWKEPHFLRYEHLLNTTTTTDNAATSPHVGVESHYDGSHFTWSLMLSRPDEYAGGGTYIRQLRTTFRLDQGQVLLHPGDLYHTGIDITSGVRELMICFMDGWDSMTRDSSNEDDDCEEYQKNIRQTYFGGLL